MSRMSWSVLGQRNLGRALIELRPEASRAPEVTEPLGVLRARIACPPFGSPTVLAQLTASHGYSADVTTC